VAIKRLHAHLSEDPDFVAMFLDEARLAARIHHPNVIQTLDIESSEGELFVVLDYVHGDSLSRLLRESRRLGEPVTSALAGAILFGALEGLHAAHEARDARGDPLELVHRDVSPHNLLVGTDGIARVLDFGVVKARGRAQTTRVGQFKGKLAYMAPEQLRGTVTRRTDVFAASVVLWEALTGVRLFAGEDDEIIDKLLHKPIPSPREHAPLVTRQLESVVMRGLERDPSRRFATARDMAVALESHATLATPIEVGAWVERVAGVTLVHRAERVAAIEAESDEGDGAEPRHAGLVHPGPHRPTAPSLTGATVPTVAVPGLARTDDRTIQVSIEPMRTGMASVSDVRAPRRRRLVGGASLVGGGAVLAVVLIVRACTHDAPAQSASASPQPDLAAASAGPPPLPPTPAPAADSSAPNDSAESRPPSPETTPRRVSAPQTAPRKRADCVTPYTIDSRGVRHYKPECL
jgi:hypothetical protein